MDRHLAERMVGAAVLVAVLVAVVPSILDGRRAGPAPDETPAPTGGGIDLRTHTIHLDGEDRAPPVPRPVSAMPAAAVPVPPEPEVPDAAIPAAKEPEVPEAALPVKEPAISDAAVSAAKKPTAPVLPASAGKERPVAAAPAAKAPAPAAAAAAAQKPAPAAAAPPGGEWVVQLGSFSGRDNAERLLAELRRRGYDAAISTGRGPAGPMYRVRTRPATSREEADRLASRLAGAGFKGQVARR